MHNATLALQLTRPILVTPLLTTTGVRRARRPGAPHNPTPRLKVLLIRTSEQNTLAARRNRFLRTRCGPEALGGEMSLQRRRRCQHPRARHRRRCPVLRPRLLRRSNRTMHSVRGSSLGKLPVETASTRMAPLLKFTSTGYVRR